MSDFDFDLMARQPVSQARAGLIHTPHGYIPTPSFIPVGTQGTVKSVSPRELREMGASVLMANTYHLHLRPGAEAIAQLGGLHLFMGWDGPLMTDSGGFQVFSLAHRRRISEDGVTFRSHIDGSEHFFSPERVIAIQESLGADIILPLDECPPHTVDRDYNLQALERTHRWAERSLAAHQRPDQALYGIVQGGLDPQLRRESAENLRALDFAGYAIGGLSVGEPKETMHRVLDITIPSLPEDRPRHLLGVGSPEDIFEAVSRGVDTFDCVLPTRIARNGALLTHRGRLNIRNARHALDSRPVEEGCTCSTCQQFSRAYLRHLVMANEILGIRLATVHNLHFLLDLSRRIRISILDGSFTSFRSDFLNTFVSVDPVVRQRNVAARQRKWREDR
jgi:queuine tRNA-ribosyltransferase